MNNICTYIYITGNRCNLKCKEGSDQICQLHYDILYKIVLSQLKQSNHNTDSNFDMEEDENDYTNQDEYENENHNYELDENLEELNLNETLNSNTLESKSLENSYFMKNYILEKYGQYHFLTNIFSQTKCDICFVTNKICIKPNCCLGNNSICKDCYVELFYREISCIHFCEIRRYIECDIEFLLKNICVSCPFCRQLTGIYDLSTHKDDLLYILKKKMFLNTE